MEQWDLWTQLASKSRLRTAVSVAREPIGVVLIYADGARCVGEERVRNEPTSMIVRFASRVLNC